MTVHAHSMDGKNECCIHSISKKLIKEHRENDLSSFSKNFLVNVTQVLRTTSKKYVLNNLSGGLPHRQELVSFQDCHLSYCFESTGSRGVNTTYFLACRHLLTHVRIRTRTRTVWLLSLAPYLHVDGVVVLNRRHDALNEFEKDEHVLLYSRQLTSAVLQGGDYTQHRRRVLAGVDRGMGSRQMWMWVDCNSLFGIVLHNIL